MKKGIKTKGGLLISHDDAQDEAIMKVCVKGENFPWIAIRRTIGDEVTKTDGVIRN